MSLDTLAETFHHELSDLLSAEKQFAKALQLVIKNADSDTVRQMAEEHLTETEGHAENLMKAFEILGEKPERMVCEAAKGICDEGKSTLSEEKPKGAIKDTVLIGSSLRIEHYEIAGYTAAIAIAKALGHKQIVPLLQFNLKQEQATAKKLDAAAPPILQAALAAVAPEKPAAKKAPAKRGPKPGIRTSAKRTAAK